MDWARAIERNQTALTRIVAALMAMVEMSAFGAMRLPQTAYFAVLRILRPAESAVRRLIFIAGGADNAFAFRGTGAFTAAGQVRINASGDVEINTGGTLAADMVIDIQQGIVSDALDFLL